MIKITVILDCLVLDAELEYIVIKETNERLPPESQACVNFSFGKLLSY